MLCRRLNNIGMLEKYASALFSTFYGSGTTVRETKLSHHALVRPGRIKNLIDLRYGVSAPVL